MSEPTARQLEIHTFMLRYQAEHGSPPSYREIRAEFDFSSTNTVHCHLVLLFKKGLVRHRPGVARGWVALPVESKEGNAA